jgi:hypothetical protein
MSNSALEAKNVSHQELGFTWWQVQGWSSLIIGSLVLYSMTRVTAEELQSIFWLLFAINALSSILIIQYNRWAFLIATVLSFNPLLWVMNGIYLKNRWEHPRVTKQSQAGTASQSGAVQSSPSTPARPAAVPRAHSTERLQDAGATQMTRFKAQQDAGQNADRGQPAPAASQAAQRGILQEGERVLGNSRYHTFLVKKYAIEKNETLGKYLVDLDAFDDLSQALAYAHGLESSEFRHTGQVAPIGNALDSTHAAAPQHTAITETSAEEPASSLSALEPKKSSLSQNDRDAIDKLSNFCYRLKDIEKSGAGLVFFFVSTTSGEEFFIKGSAGLDQFASQF